MKMNAKQLTIHALSIALVCVATMIIQIPIPLGYMHLGNCCILLIGVCFGKTTGALAGGIGSALADLLTGYPQWILPTLVIKGIMGYAAGRLSLESAESETACNSQPAYGHKPTRHVRMASFRTLAASVTSILIMIAGYTTAGSILYGSLAAGLAQIPGLALEGVLGIVLFYVAGFAFEAAKLPMLFNKNA